jgi:hypothetical protein
MAAAQPELQRSQNCNAASRVEREFTIVLIKKPIREKELQYSGY